MINIIFKCVKPNNPDIYKLIKSLDQYLLMQYPDRPIFGIDLEKASQENVHFIVGYNNDQAVCCGAIRLFNDNRCELKRMFVLDEYRGKGISKKLYYELENLAISKNKKIIILETGKKQSEAINLYKSLGFKIIPNYGEFIKDEISLCFSKTISE